MTSVPGPAGTLLPDAHLGLAVDHVEDLVGGVRLLGARILAGRDGHDGGLAALRLLQHPEEVAAVIGRPDDERSAAHARLLHRVQTILPPMFTRKNA